MNVTPSDSDLAYLTVFGLPCVGSPGPKSAVVCAGSARSVEAGNALCAERAPISGRVPVNARNCPSLVVLTSGSTTTSFATLAVRDKVGAVRITL